MKLKLNETIFILSSISFDISVSIMSKVCVVSFFFVVLILAKGKGENPTQYNQGEKKMIHSMNVGQRGQRLHQQQKHNSI